MRSSLAKLLVLSGLIFPLLSFGAADVFLQREWADASWRKLAGSMAIQAGGRVKPLNTFAREGADLLYGRESYKKKPALDFLFSLAFEPQIWQEEPFVQVTHRPLRQDLGLSMERTHFSPQELMHASRLTSLFQELDAKQKAQEKLDPYFQAVQRMGNQLGFVQEVISGRALRLVPPTVEEFKTSDHWAGFDRFSEEQKLRFALIAAGYTSADPTVRAKLGEYLTRFQEMAKAQNAKLYPAESRLKMETHFNELRPFRWAWVLSLVGSILLAFALYSAGSAWYLAGLAAYALCFALQVYGFVLRCLIAGRPPVSNMYESVIWVAFGAMFFGAILEAVYRKRVIALGSLIFATLALIVADQSTAVIDDGIHPLEPVLRSNLWLTVHVLTITLGYAAFALSLVFGNMGLGQYAIFGKESQRTPVRQLAFYSYRAVQVGVILLAAGTILGGVWADYSWGRFWGWDPKETWALIALLGYLALIHARFSGLVGPFGFLVGCVLAFLGVIMAWYGVNFVLGAGLHSYGFGAGGVSYVATYCCIQVAFVLLAYYQFRQSRRARM